MKIFLDPRKIAGPEDWDSDFSKGQCIFCRRKATTREDYWPRWMQAKFPFSQKEKSLHRTSIIDADSSVPSRSIKVKSGLVIRQTVRRLCNECNNVWGSKIQENAKSVIEQLENNDVSYLDNNQVNQLLDWLTMFIMSAEFKDPKSVAISQGMRESFRAGADMRHVVSVRMGRYSGRSYTFSDHHVNSFKCQSVENGYAMVALAQTTTLALSRYFFQVFTIMEYFPGVGGDMCIRWFESFKKNAVEIKRDIALCIPSKKTSDLILHDMATAVSSPENRCLLQKKYLPFSIVFETGSTFKMR